MKEEDKDLCELRITKSNSQQGGLSPWYVDCWVQIRRVLPDGSHKTIWHGPIWELIDLLMESANLLGYIGTCQTSVRKAWMEGLVERCNALLERLHDPDRVRTYANCLRVDRGGSEEQAIG